MVFIGILIIFRCISLRADLFSFALDLNCRILKIKSNSPKSIVGYACMGTWQNIGIGSSQTLGAGKVRDRDLLTKGIWSDLEFNGGPAGEAPEALRLNAKQRLKP